MKLRNGTKFYTNNDIMDVVAIIENFDFYNQHDYFMMNKNLSKPKIVDIGAHIGTFSIYAARKYPDGIIYSYEPDKKNYEKLVMNVTLNKIENVIPFNLAVGKINGKTLLYSDEKGSFGTVGSSLIKKQTKSVEVSCITLDDILTINNIDPVDLLKIDCEGGEYDIIFNSNKKTFDKIKSISLEYHNVSNFKGSDIEIFLKEQGYNVKRIPSKKNDRFGFIYANKI